MTIKHFYSDTEDDYPFYLINYDQFCTDPSIEPELVNRESPLKYSESEFKRLAELQCCEVIFKEYYMIFVSRIKCKPMDEICYHRPSNQEDNNKNNKRDRLFEFCAEAFIINNFFD